ncbi:Rv2732c family membrane protein [Rhodococcus sp. NPDC055112]
MTDDLSHYRADFREIENRVTREFVAGWRRPAITAVVLVLTVGLALPHAGSLPGWVVLAGAPNQEHAATPAPLRLFIVFVVTFGIIASMLGTWSRRWAVAQIAVMGTGVGTVLGLLGYWSQQSLPPGIRPTGIEYGLILTWAGMAALTALWVPVVLSRANIMQADVSAPR